MRYLFLALCLFILPGLWAQEPEKTIKQYPGRYPQEKVVLSFSKPEYIAGENLYFKAYVLSGYEPSLLSSNLYTELYDKEKNLLQKQLLPLYEGVGTGYFALPASLAEDVYYIRAYTQWMRNFDEAFFYLKPVLIYNPYSSQTLRPKPVQWTAQAFIEGGNLLENVPANIAVRLFATGTLPEHWSGQLTEHDNQTLAEEITVYNREIGRVRFIPQEGKQYKLLLKDNLGKQQEVALPPVQKKGVALQASVTAAGLRYGILFKDIPSGGKGYKLIGTFNSEPVMTVTVTDSPGQVGGTLDISNLPAGVLQLTVLDEKGKPLTERLLFLHQDATSPSLLSIRTDTLSFAPKAHNYLQVISDRLNWQTCSVTVGDASLWQPTDFLSAVYLTSDFPTPVYQPEWYFTAVTQQKMAALDALLLTEKWNRFPWDSLIQNRFPPVRYQPDTYLSFTGTLKKGNKSQPLRKVILGLKAADFSLSFIQVTTDSTGTFTLSNLYFTDSLNIFYQPGKRKAFESNLEISFTSENLFSPFDETLPYTPMTVGKRSTADSVPVAVQKAVVQRATELVLAEKTKILEEVVIKTKVRNATQELERKLTSGLFRGGHADIFDFVNQNHTGTAGFRNILEWLQGRVPGFMLSYRGSTCIPRMRNGFVQLFLNEMSIPADFISSLSPSDIALIKVYRESFGFDGNAIAIYTRRGGMESKNNTPLLPFATLKGYQKIPPPFMPDYSQGTAGELKDERTVLLYKPFLQPTDGTNKAAIEFYNNDNATQFRVQVTGFAIDGRPFSLDKIIHQ